METMILFAVSFAFYVAVERAKDRRAAAEGRTRAWWESI